MTDIDAIRAGHAGCTPDRCVQWEGTTMEPWPCDTAVVLADADRLAFHLQRAIHDLVGDWELSGGPTMNYPEARAALALHKQICGETYK